MDGQVPDMIKAKRSEELIALEEEMALNYHKLFLGREEEVLLEEIMEIDGETYQTGYTKHYVKVAVKTDRDLSNEIVTLQLLEMYNHEIVLAQF